MQNSHATKGSIMHINIDFQGIFQGMTSEDRGILSYDLGPSQYTENKSQLERVVKYSGGVIGPISSKNPAGHCN